VILVLWVCVYVCSCIDVRRVDAWCASVVGVRVGRMSIFFCLERDGWGGDEVAKCGVGGADEKGKVRSRGRRKNGRTRPGTYTERIYIPHMIVPELVPPLHIDTRPTSPYFPSFTALFLV